MIAVLFGTFNAGHAANALLIDDLKRAGVEVRICHAPLWEEERDKHAEYFSPASLARLGLRWGRLVARLGLRFGYAAAGADLVVAGFNGQLDVLVARRLAGRRSIVFAPLVTISETLIDDRARYAEGSNAARALGWLDRASLSAADLVLIDTRAHLDYVASRFGIPRQRILVQYLGAEEIFRPAAGEWAPPAERKERLRVLAYGTYLPLHGTEVVARAFRLLAPEEGIALELIGSGPERAACEALVRGLPHVTLVDWVPYEEMPERIRRADVVLGIFGTTVKARMVIPNKIYQAAQVGRAIVTADTPAVREVFTPGESIVTIEPTPEELAAALRRLASEMDESERIGARAREAVERAASADVRAQRLARALEATRAGRPVVS